jgi:DNA ligase-1
VRALADARGAGSRAAKERLLAELFALLTPVEAKYVAKNLVREMRTGVAEGVLVDALARLAGGDRAAIARAHLLEGDLAAVARASCRPRRRRCRRRASSTFRPLRPMLAQTAETAASALATFAGRAAVEEKLDGARVQIHRRGDECRLYSRRLQDLTPSLPDVVAPCAPGSAHRRRSSRARWSRSTPTAVRCRSRSSCGASGA